MIFTSMAAFLDHEMEVPRGLTNRERRTETAAPESEILTRTRILLAEDHKDMRERVVRLLEPEYEVVGAVEDGLALLDAAGRMRPEVCVLDISMPRMNGIEAANHLRECAPALKVIFLTVHEDQDFVRAALATGALGYVVKSWMASDLRAAIRAALAGRLFVTPSCCLAMMASDLRSVIRETLADWPSGSSSRRPAALRCRTS
jgi:DNA-binding NarL/FixJ family response regulator